MKRIVLAWELGGGLGHLYRLKTLARKILQCGHQVILISRDQNSAQTVFADIPVPCLAAPPSPSLTAPLDQTPAYVHVLFNSGYGDQEILSRKVSNWYQLLRRLEPDLLIADHAPTALMVSRNLLIPRINFGDGFTCPPPSRPLPVLLNSIPLKQVLDDEQVILNHCNRALDSLGLTSLTALGDIFQVDETFLLTIPELDHLGVRPQVHYCGPLSPETSGTLPLWPSTDQVNRVFVYLKEFDKLPEFLGNLNKCQAQFLIFINNLPASLQSIFQQYPHIRFSDHPVNICSVLQEADLVISHGGHQITLQAAQAGVPQLHLPLTLEQQLLSEKCQQAGISEFIFPHEYFGQPTSIIETLATKRKRAKALAQQISVNRHNHLGRCLTLINYHLGCSDVVPELLQTKQS